MRLHLYEARSFSGFGDQGSPLGPDLRALQTPCRDILPDVKSGQAVKNEDEV